MALYLAVTLTYSAIWKHIAVIDLVAIASGFVLRAAAGAVAVDVPMSSWFVLCTTFGSLFIVTGKRFAESRELGDDAAPPAPDARRLQRGVPAVRAGDRLRRRAGELLHVGLRAPRPRPALDLPFYELSIVPMLTAFLRYALILEQGHGAAPEEVFAQRPGAAGAGRDLGARVRLAVYA